MSDSSVLDARAEQATSPPAAAPPAVRSAFRRVLAVLGAALVLLPAAARAQGNTGTITGRVTEQGGAPVGEVQVGVVGTTLGARTSADGSFTIRAVPAGERRVRALRIGYAEQTTTATVAPGQTATVTITVTRSVLQLNEVVTTATGQTQRVLEQGNAVSTIDASNITATSAVSQVSDVLNSRTPGVQVSTGSATGVGSRIRIRGSSSLNLSNDPIYIIDGVRMTSDAGSSNLGTGGPQPSRVGDINPEDIENIEVVRGPSAATLYGTDAANGVIVITTKRGRSGGRAQWNTYAEGGVIEDVVNRYEPNYTLAGHAPNSTGYLECTLPQVSAGSCVADSLRVLNLIDNKQLSPIQGGNRWQAGANVSGGTNLVQYFLSGEREEETGVLQLPPFERARLNSEETTIDPWVERPNTYGKNSFRTNLNSSLNSKLDVGVQAGYTRVDQRFPQDANSTAGLGSHLFGGKGYTENGTVAGTGTPLSGYRAWTPGYTFQERNEQAVNRFIGSSSANWRPVSWLQTNGVFGVDYTSRVDERLRIFGQGPPLNATYRNGFKQNSRADITNITANIAATGTWQPREWLNSRTTGGVQYVNYQFTRNNAQSSELPPGAITAGSGAVPGVGEATNISKTLGVFLQEELAFRDRLFVTGALRSDQNSAFGTDFESVIYPKASVSWLASDEAFFPKAAWLNQFRLRASYGASGRQPRPNDALEFYTSQSASIGATDQSTVFYQSIGNQELKPERTAEFETGFDARLFGNRTNVEFTYYHKRTKDALIDAVVAPSLGDSSRVSQNIGSVRNIGFEFLVNTQVVNKSWWGVDLTLNGSTNDNLLVSLGEVAPQIDPNFRVVAGRPLFNWYSRKISGWEDKNSDGILTYNANPALNEVFVDDSASFIDDAAPKYNISFTPAVELFARKLRLSSLFDYRGGFHWYNLTEEFRCASRANCPGLNNPDASFREQAASVARRDHPARTSAGYIEDGDFVRLRELSATLTLPTRLVSRMKGVRSASLNFAARNVALWTKYSGIDPEAFWNVGGNQDNLNNARGQDFQSLGPPSYYILRLNVGF